MKKIQNKETFIRIGKKRLIQDFLWNSDSEYIMSAIKGEQRTRTGLRYRGVGLSTIPKSISKKDVSDMIILSKNGKVQLNENGTRLFDLKTSFNGTLFCWIIKKDPCYV